MSEQAGTKREHKDVVREEFTRQAEDYAVAPAITDPEHIAQLLRMVRPAADARVLEVATGPGHVAMAFAKVAREVVGVDLTQAPLKIAEQMRLERALGNVTFRTADAEKLPFEDGEFDVVVCRFAFHHFEHPAIVISEMSRVCRKGGTVAVEDLISSEHPERAEYYNGFERLRDQSHTRALPMSELIRIMTDAGLELMRFESSAIRNPVEPWLKSAQTPPDRANDARAMIERDLEQDLSGARPFRLNDELFFTHRVAIVVARKLS